MSVFTGPVQNRRRDFCLRHLDCLKIYFQKIIFSLNKYPFPLGTNEGVNTASFRALNASASMTCAIATQACLSSSAFHRWPSVNGLDMRTSRPHSMCILICTPTNSTKSPKCWPRNYSPKRGKFLFLMWYDSGTQRHKGKKKNRRKPSVYAGFRWFEIQNSIIPTRWCRWAWESDRTERG